MYLVVRRMLFWGCLLVSLAPLLAAKPVSLDTPLIVNRPRRNTTLGASHPWGPADFHVHKSHETSPIRRDAAFMTAIGLLAQQAQKDFNGRLSRPTIVFRDPRFNPRLQIVVTAQGPNERLPRRYVFWGIARILNHMIHHNTFIGSIWKLFWQGEIVGTIFFIAGSPSQLDTGSPKLTINPTLSQPLNIQRNANNTAISATNAALSYEFEFWGRILPIDDVFMSAIGALTDLAERVDQAFYSFTGIFQGYPACHLWQSRTGQPSLMTKGRVIAFIVASVTYNLDQSD